MDKILGYLKNNEGLSTTFKNYTVDNDLAKIVKIYDSNWETGVTNIPYEALTQLVDSYAILINRPDLAFLFCWEAINNSYNELIIKDTALNRLTDTKGIDLLLVSIYSSYSTYQPFVDTYASKLPLKLCKYVSSYILKGFVLKENGFSDKHINSSHNSFKKNFPDFYDAITKTYGMKLLSIASPTIAGNYVKLNSDEQQTRQIMYSLAMKIQEIIRLKSTSLRTPDNSKIFNVTFTEKQILDFLLLQILYASRCNNFHGNVASRLNSINANQDSYDSYKYVYLLAHTILGIAFHINEYISKDVLNHLKGNESLLK